MYVECITHRTVLYLYGSTPFPDVIKHSQVDPTAHADGADYNTLNGEGQQLPLGSRQNPLNVSHSCVDISTKRSDKLTQ